MKHDDYWAKRFAMLMAAEMKKADDLTAELVAAYRQTAASINADIAKWYARFAKENKMSLADARRVLNARELAEFRWTVQEYIRYGEENALTGVYIQRLKNASARVHIDRLEAIRSQMAHHVESLAAKTNEKLTEVLKDIYPDARERTAWEVQRKKGFDPFAALPEGEVERVLKKPWVGDGMTFSDRIWRDKEKLLRVLQTDLTQGLIRGEGYDKIARRIAEKMGVARSAAARLVETEAAFFSSRGQLDSFQALGVKEVEFVATLDSRTSEICQAMDGKVLPLSECKPGITMPPLHCRCRSTTCPHFDDAFTEGETRAARDPERGKTVQIPGEMRYADWKKVFVDKTKTYARWRRDNLFKRGILQYITVDYFAAGRKKDASIKIPPKDIYSEQKHQDEIRICSFLQRLIGGDMELLVERNERGIKTPDFSWDGLLWELKVISTPNAADKALRKALKQISSMVGGVVLWLSGGVEGLDEIITMIANRLYRSTTADIIIVIGAQDNILKILRYTKKK